MKPVFVKYSLVFFIVAVLAGGGLWVGEYESKGTNTSAHSPATSSAGSRVTGPVASVRTAPIRKQEISEEIVAYGTVLSAPGRLRTLSVPFDAEIRTVHVIEGQEVSRDEKLFEVRPGPDVLLEMKTARTAYETAGDLLQKAKERIKLKLATRQELLQAEQTFREAQLKMKSLKKRGIAERAVIHSPSDGVITHVFEQSGARIAAGTAVMEISPRDAAEVRLGLESEDLSRVRAGHKVMVTPVNRPEVGAIPGTVRSVSKIVNPSTRLLDILVTIPSPSPLLLNEYVRGRILLKSRKGLVVPRSSVLREGNESILFTIKNNRAVRHRVAVGLETRKDVEIQAKSLSPLDSVVTIGNYELQDGMAVRTEAFR